MLFKLQSKAGQNDATAGFTLIELLIVVLIIAVLSGIVLSVVNVTGIRSKSRDSQRISDLKKIQVALELYFTDLGSYPVTANWINLGTGNALETELTAGGYLNRFPHDPQGSSDINPCSIPANTRYNYRSINSGGDYLLTAIMEVETSNTGFECDNLTGWNTTVGCAAGFATEDFCYGVESP